ncbi:uncharacterized protein LOC125590358 [Brassica napus]|nr:uncharacterized protein LOC125590358 [Brassica napus]
MPPTTNVTYIRLIPKITGAKSVADYRPIALCNVTYKVITKIISLRIKATLQGIIWETQSAFVPGRAISDNVLITHEILHTLKNSEAVVNCSMAVKTDMSKAYDRLEWNFIETVLLRFGFASHLVALIMQCVTSVTYSFLVNDSVHGRVIPSRGIRQGDPLSPYLFILCGEILSGLCKRAQRSGHLAGLRISIPAPRLNHLLFADDTMFFLNTDEESCSALMHILEQYKMASGQLINATKSSITFSAKTPQKQSGFLGYTSPIKRWQTGYVEVCTYSGSFFLYDVLPPSYELMRSNPIHSNEIWVAWEKLIKPKAHGGLGIRDIQAFKKALLAKQTWRIITKPDCLLSRILRGKYCTNASFLQVSETKTMSHGWRSIIAGRDLLVTRLGKVIGNGEGTRVWKDPWLRLDHPTVPFGPVKESDQDLFVSDLICRGSGEWNINQITSIMPHLLPEILCIRPSITGAPDFYAWLDSKTGVYSVKSGYFVAASMIQVEDNEATEAQRITEQALNKGIWTCKTSPKLHLFLWKIFHGALPLGENLAKRGMLTNISCRRCGELETADHIFLHCAFTRRIWSASIWRNEFILTDTSTLATIFLESANYINLPPLGIKETIFPWICWAIWTARNYLIFENRNFEPIDILSKAIANAREWNAAQLPGLDPPIARNPRLPPTLTITTEPACFTDAAWHSSTNRVGCGWYILTPEKTITLQGTRMFEHISSPLMAEALAIRSALLHALDAGITLICIKSDCQALINALSSKYHSADIYGIIRDIEALSYRFSRISFSFIPRSQNSMADTLAKSAMYSAFSN